MSKIKKYKVEFIQSEVFEVEVEAMNKEQAKRYAETAFNEGNYSGVGDLTVEIKKVYKKN